MGFHTQVVFRIPITRSVIGLRAYCESMRAPDHAKAPVKSKQVVVLGGAEVCRRTHTHCIHIIIHLYICIFDACRERERERENMLYIICPQSLSSTGFASPQGPNESHPAHDSL